MPATHGLCLYSNNTAEAPRTPLSGQGVAICKPSLVVSSALPNLLSFLVPDHAMMADDRGTIPRQGRRQGQAAKRPDPHSGGSNVCKDNDAKAKTQEINNEPVASLSGVDDIGGHAKPDQYGRSMCRLGHGSARASSREAFLTVDSN
jgi:hypothetical protein